MLATIYHLSAGKKYHIMKRESWFFQYSNITWFKKLKMTTICRLYKVCKKYSEIVATTKILVFILAPPSQQWNWCIFTTNTRCSERRFNYFTLLFINYLYNHYFLFFSILIIIHPLTFTWCGYVTLRFVGLGKSEK